MDYQEKFNHDEIEAIANKFTNNEFVNHDELKKWYEYKRTINYDIHNAKAYLKMVDEAHQNEEDWIEHRITTKIRNELKEAENELNWIRTIVTYDIRKVAEFITYWDKSHDDRNGRSMSYIFAQRILNDDLTEAELNIIRQGLEESNGKFYINVVRKITTPVQNRNWYYSYNNPTSYHPTETPCDASVCDKRTHYVYIHSECTGRYGETYWISNNCSETLEALPVIKDFKNYDFEVGKFYKIQCTDVIHFGRNKKKYVMNIEPCTEAEFMDNGFIQYAKRHY